MTFLLTAFGGILVIGVNGCIMGYILLQVTDWWVKYVYLYWRGSIMINSNYYCCVREREREREREKREGER